jgi:hypothetical protein
VNWALGNPEYSSGGSVLGNIAKFSAGSGYPETLAAPFTITITSSKSKIPAKIISCCADNVITFAVPPADDG